MKIKHLFDTLGRIPSDGEQSIELELPTMKILVKKVEAHQIEEAVVTLKKIEQTEE